MRIEADDPSKKQPKKEEFNPVKSEKHSFKSEIAKMKSMGFKDGWEYFWSYYKVPVFVIIGVIAIVISITMSVIRNSRPFIVQVHVYNNYLSDNADVDSLEKEFAAYELMGMEVKTVRNLFLVENGIIGGVAFLLGTLVGTGLSGLLNQVVQNIFEVPHPLS